MVYFSILLVYIFGYFLGIFGVFCCLFGIFLVRFFGIFYAFHLVIGGGNGDCHRALLRGNTLQPVTRHLAASTSKMADQPAASKQSCVDVSEENL